MLYIGKDDIEKAADLNHVMDIIEKAYQIDLEGNYEMPSRIHVNHGNNTLLYMPCFLENIFGTKFLSLFPGNSEKDLPVIEGVVILNNAETGKPLAILDGASITTLRTGAVGGVAVRHTTGKNIKSVGLIGSGIQGCQQLIFACKARPSIKHIHLFDLSKERIFDLEEKLKKKLPGVNIIAANSAEDLISHSEVIITATPSVKPVLPDDPELLLNRHYIGIGSYKPEMREFPKSLYKLVENVFIDTNHGFDESGDLITPLQGKWLEKKSFIRMGELIKNPGRYKLENSTTLFKSVGMALFDITVSEFIYKMALEKELGTALDS